MGEVNKTASPFNQRNGAVKMKRIIWIVALVCCIATSTSTWAGFDEGLAAYNNKDYSTAVNELLPLAKHGNADAKRVVTNILDSYHAILFQGWLMKLAGFGVRPSDDEIKVKMDSIRMPPVIFEILEGELPEILPAMQKQADAGNNWLIVNAKNAQTARQSKSETTRDMGKKIVKMLDDFRDQQRKRNVEGLAKTKQEIHDLAHKANHRIDSETAIEQAREAAGSDTRISSLIDEFYVAEKNVDFDPLPWVQNFLDKDVNPYLRGK